MLEIIFTGKYPQHTYRLEGNYLYEEKATLQEDRRLRVVSKPLLLYVCSTLISF